MHPALAPRATGCVPGAVDTSEQPRWEVGGAEYGSRDLCGSPEPRASPSSARGPRAGMRGAGTGGG